MMAFSKGKLTACEIVIHGASTDVEEKVNFDSVEIKVEGDDDGDVAVVVDTLESTTAVKLEKSWAIVTTPVAPDGGFGWLVSVMTFLITFFLTGFLKSFGVMRGAIEKEFPGTTASESSWISGSIGTLSLVVSPVTYALIAAYGNAFLVTSGSSLIAVGLGLSCFANCAKYLIGSLGLCMGVGASFVITSAVGCTGKYFTTRKPAAMTIALSGGCVGAMVMPFILKALLHLLGLRFTFLALSGIFVLFAVCGRVYAHPEDHFVCVAEEVEITLEEDEDDDVEGSPKEEKAEKLRFWKWAKEQMFEKLALPYLSDTVFCLTAAVVTFTCMGCPHFLGSMSARATEIGLSSDDAAWLTLCTQFGDLTARLAYGMLASKSPFIRSAELSVALAVSATCALIVPFCAAFWQFVLIACIGSIAVGVVNISIPLVLSAHHGASNMSSTLSLTRMFQGMAGLLYRQGSPLLLSHHGLTVLLLCNATNLWVAALLALVVYLKKRSQG